MVGGTYSEHGLIFAEFWTRQNGAAVVKGHPLVLTGT
jgi:hypothetical protein